ncbi:MAG: hypothetical protein GPOALKHO_001129 [Sodalis sp.]|nr:MAG: hypothetical protein GPOALKHO_001129 [Sodalis sp.]
MLALPIGEWAREICSNWSGLACNFRGFPFISSLRLLRPPGALEQNGMCLHDHCHERYYP